MKVTVSVCGRFHAFNLAQQLQKREHLHRLISTYPNFAITKYGIDNKFISSIWHLEVISRIWQRLPSWLKGDHNLHLWLLEEFDRLVTNSLTPGFDLFVGWSGSNFWSLRRAKEMGAKTVVERGSSHMRYQTAILQEEYEKWGLKFTETHPRVYEREIKSYADADRIAIPSTALRKSKVKSQKSKVLYIKAFDCLKWSIYFCRPALAYL